MVGSIDAVLTNAYVLELLWQGEAAEGDNEVRRHLKNLVSPLFLPTLLILADIFSQSTFASETAQSDIYPLWVDKANVDKSIGNIHKMNQLPVFENSLNKRLRLQHHNILEGSFTPNPNKPDQQVNIFQHYIQFQPRVRSQQQLLTPDDIINTVQERLKHISHSKKEFKIVRKDSEMLGLLKMKHAKSRGIPLMFYAIFKNFNMVYMRAYRM
jgi:hypothetical protein